MMKGCLAGKFSVGTALRLFHDVEGDDCSICLSLCEGCLVWSLPLPPPHPCAPPPSPPLSPLTNHHGRPTPAVRSPCSGWSAGGSEGEIPYARREIPENARVPDQAGCTGASRGCLYNECVLLFCCDICDLLESAVVFCPRINFGSHRSSCMWRLDFLALGPASSLATDSSKSMVTHSPCACIGTIAQS